MPIKKTKRHQHFLIGGILCFALLIISFSFFYDVIAAPPVSPYTPGETLDPSCSPTDTNCTVYPPLTTTLATSTNIIMGTTTLSFATSTLVIDAQNSRVGIGTTSPSALLSVAGNFLTTGTTTLNTLTGLLKGTSGVVSTATAGTDYENPLTFSTGLNRISNTITNNGVLSLTAGTGILVSSATGTPTITNNGVLSIQSATGTLTFASSTTGTDFTISTSGGTITWNLPSASASNRGLLTSTDWTTFNNKESAISAGTTAQYWRGDKSWQTLNQVAVSGLTTTDSPTFASTTLSNFTSGSIPFFGASGILLQNNANLFWDNTNARLGIGTTTPIGLFQIATGTITALTNGFVGIGTTTPSEQLQITGNFRLPVTTASVGIIKVGVNRFIHSYGSYNTFAGILAGNLTLTGSNNFGFGYQALTSLTSGSYNVAFGENALLSATSSEYNTAIGNETLSLLTSGSNNTALGFQALYSATSSSNNTALGYLAGYSAEGSGNVFIGYNAGYSETGSNKLYIANSSTNPPLIYGDFSTGSIGIGTTTPSGILTVGSSSPAFVVANSGNVGIGTTGPAYPLEIVTNNLINIARFTSNHVNWAALRVNAGGASANSAIAFDRQGTQKAAIKVTFDNNLVLTGPDGSGPDDYFTLNTITGNVGIGTTGPTESLSINGGLLVGGYITGWGTQGTGNVSVLNSAGNSAVRIGQDTTHYGLFKWNYNATPANAYFEFSNAGGLNPLVLQSGGGNVGIGTTAPTGNLAITQTIAATGALKGIVYTGAVNTNQTLSTEIPSLTLTTAGREWATGALATQREVLITQPAYSFVGASVITDAATLGIAGAPIQSANATITNTHGLLIQAGAVSTAANSYGLTVNAQTGATNNYAAAFMGGNVGIGTTGPSALLSVSGNILATSITATGTLTVSSTSTFAGATFSGSVGIGTTTPTGLFTVGTTTPAFVVTSSGNVGIGTTTPGYKLDISPGSGGGMRVQGGSDASWGNVWVGNALTWNDSIYYPTIKSVGGNTGSLIMFVDPHIGWSTVNQPTGYTGKAAIRAAVAYPNTSTFWDYGAGNTASAGDFFFVSRNTGSYTELLRINNAGNVGIGTTSPSALLAVSGNILATSITATGTLTVSSTSTFAGATFSGSVGIGTTTPVSLLTVGTTTNILNVLASGKIGIGTTTPSEALQISRTDENAAIRFYKLTAIGGSAVISGPNNPSTITSDSSSGGTLEWSNPGNAASSNDTYATASGGTGATSYYLNAQNLGFSIPNGSTINGIVVEIERKADVSNACDATQGACDATVKLVKGGSVVGSNYASTSLPWPTSDTYKTYGGASDLWGATWAASDINASNFGVVISATFYGPGTTNASVDHIRITVYYTTVNGGIASYTIGVDNNDSSSFKISASSALGTTDALTITTSAFIGIGTTTPVGLLHIATGTTNALVVTASGGVGIGTISPVGLFHIATGTTNALMVSSLGYVGIGTTTPVGLLQVATGSFTVLSSGLVGVGTTSPSAFFAVQGNVSGTLANFQGAAGGTSSFYINGGNSGILDTYLNAGNLSTSHNALYFQAGGSTSWVLGLSRDSTTDFYLGDSISSGYIQNPRIVIKGTTGYIGMGTTTPLGLLHIATGTTNAFIVSPLGYVGISTTTPVGLFQIATGTITALANGFIGMGTTTPADLLHITRATSTYLIVSTNASTTGYIGIGTTTPIEKLTVNAGNIRLSNDYWLNAYDTGTGTVNILKVNTSSEIEIGAALSMAGGIEAVEDVGVFTLLDMPVSASTSVGSSTAALLRIDGENLLSIYGQGDGAGGVQNLGIGIGTTTPISLLHIFGTTSILTLQDKTAGSKAYQLRVGTSSLGAFDIYDYSSTTARLTINSSGYIGIGTTTPVGLLQVATGSLTVLSNGLVGIGTTTPVGLLQVATGTITALVNGNVGIGTTTPQAKLSVEGDIFPATDNSYYLGKNSATTPYAWKGVILKDTTNGNYYKIEITNGVITATQL